MRPYLAIPLAALVAQAAHAQCTKDTDCKGDRICLDGACRDSARPYLPAGPQAAAGTATAGWARGAAVYGFVSTAAAVALGTGAAIFNGQQVPALSLGGAATVLLGVSVPIVAAGSASARGPGVHGLNGLRITGWVLYALTMADAAVALGLGIADLSVPTAVIVALVGLGAGAGITMSLDALFAAQDAEAAMAPGSALGPRLLPTVFLARGAEGRAQPALGLVGSF